MGLWDDITDKGPSLAPLLGLVELVSLSQTFRERCGLSHDDPDASEKLIFGADATSAEAAFQQRIFYPVVDMQTFDVFPSAVVYLGDSFGYRFAAGGDRNYLHAYGSLELILADEDRSLDDIVESTELFLQFEGNTIDEIQANFAAGEYLAGCEVRRLVTPQLFSVESGDSANMRYWAVKYAIEWQG